MGIRMHQHMGLSIDALAFLDENALYAPCQCCGVSGRSIDDCKIPSKQRVSYEVYTGMFDDEYPLYVYTLKDGMIAEEFVQVDPWSSGPVIFLGLRVIDQDVGETINKFEWTEEEIQANI